MFRVQVDAVRVEVLVTDGHQPIADLTARDFELRDMGVIQAIQVASLRDMPLNVLLVLDVSGSVRGQRLTDLRKAALALVDLLQPSDQAALLTFSGALRLQCPWTNDRTELSSAIDEAWAEGGTALYDAAYAALTLCDPDRGPALVLIFSDGQDTASWLSGIAVLDIARRAGAVVYAVTLSHDRNIAAGYLLDFKSGIQEPQPARPGSELTQPFLAALPAETGGGRMDVDRTDALPAIFTRIVTEFRSRYVVTYIPRGVDTSGWHRLQIRLRRRQGRVIARPGYVRD